MSTSKIELPIVILGSAAAAFMALVIIYGAKQETNRDEVTIQESCHARVGKFSYKNYRSAKHLPGLANLAYRILTEKV